MFTPIAVVFAQTFVAAPYYIKSATFGLASVPRNLEEAAALDEASPLQTFRDVTVPVAGRALLACRPLLGPARANSAPTIIFAGNYPAEPRRCPGGSRLPDRPRAGDHPGPVLLHPSDSIAIASPSAKSPGEDSWTFQFPLKTVTHRSRRIRRDQPG